MCLLILALCHPPLAPCEGTVAVRSSDELRAPFIAGPPQHGPWQRVAITHTFQESSLAGKDGTVFVFHIPGWGRRCLWESERAWRVCVAAPPPQAVQQSKHTALIGVKANEGRPRGGSQPCLPGLRCRKHVPVSCVQEVFRNSVHYRTASSRLDLWTGWGRSREEMNPQPVSGRFPGHLPGTMQCGELGNFKTRPFLLPLIYEMARCMSQTQHTR